MNCVDCANKVYCQPYQENKNMRGCTNGKPEFLPDTVAQLVVRKVNRAVDEMDFDREKYSRDVLDAVKSALKA